MFTLTQPTYDPLLENSGVEEIASAILSDLHATPRERALAQRVEDVIGEKELAESERDEMEKSADEEAKDFEARIKKLEESLDDVEGERDRLADAVSEYENAEPDNRYSPFGLICNAARRLQVAA